MTMRTWKNTLFLDAMPGRQKVGRGSGDFDLWQQEMTENGIATVVCLTPEESIQAESPEYAAWRKRQYGFGRYELIDLPVDDFRAPEPFVAGRFWRQAKQVARKIEAGEKVFVHCGAGIGRTGMFAVAVLMQIGYTYDEAYREIEAIGSNPETPAQQAFLQNGPKEEDARNER